MEGLPRVDATVDPFGESEPRETGPTEDPEVGALLEDWLTSTTDPSGPPGAAGDAPPRSDGPPPPPVEATLLAALAADEPVETAESEPTPGATDPSPAAPRPSRYLLFSVAGSLYGVPEALVIEVGRVAAITPVPRVPAWVRGVMNLHGDIVSVVDLRVFLGLDPTSPHTGRLLVVRLVDQEFSVGLLTDGVEQIVGVPLDEVRPPAAAMDGALASFLTGIAQIGERHVAVLDLDRWLRSADIRQFDDNKEATPDA